MKRKLKKLLTEIVHLCKTNDETSNHLKVDGMVIQFIVRPVKDWCEQCGRKL